MDYQKLWDELLELTNNEIVIVNGKYHVRDKSSGFIGHDTNKKYIVSQVLFDAKEHCCTKAEIKKYEKLERYINEFYLKKEERK